MTLYYCQQATHATPLQGEPDHMTAVLIAQGLSVQWAVFEQATIAMTSTLKSLP